MTHKDKKAWRLLKLLFLVVIGSIGLTNCNTNSTTTNNNQPIKDTLTQLDNSYTVNAHFLLIKKTIDALKMGDAASIQLSFETNSADSVQLLLENKIIANHIKSGKAIEIKELTLLCGTKKLKAIFFKKTQQTSKDTSIQILSNIIPPTYGYQIVNTYPHDKNAYTQGLQFVDNGFYETTGLNGESSVRRVKFPSMEIQNAYTLNAMYFGEGLTLLNGKLYQITWQNKTGFVYDPSSLKIIQEFHYDTEGWGLTNDGQQLIMSDGSNRLFYIDPSTFVVTKTIEVFDNKATVERINELEYINGTLFANIYQTDKIMEINPKTGCVLAYWNLAGLLKPDDVENGTDVLNGIAWDEKGKRLFVTGKKWPKIFEIKKKV